MIGAAGALPAALIVFVLADPADAGSHAAAPSLSCFKLPENDRFRIFPELFINALS